LTLLNIYIAISSLIFLVAAIAVVLIFFTPIKTMVPGYGDPSEDPAYMELYRKVQDMEKQLIAYEIYTSNFQKMIMGYDSSSSDQVSPAVQPTKAYTSDLNDNQYQLPTRESGIVIMRGDSGNTYKDPEEMVLLSQTKKVNSLDNLYLVSPVTGTVSSIFDPGIDHYGVDVLAPKDTPVKSILDGYVITSDWTLETGNTIGVQHADNLVSFYKHNAVLLKKVGDYIPAGEAIALVGNTGKFSSGPHLHFELWQNGLPVDPLNYINFK
jgi:murein DD-endopeptidase MepM/ murein hydrolase activator NlpD